MAVKRDTLRVYLDNLLKPEQFDDYGPNGLQIEGREEVRKVAFAVSATRDSALQSVSWGADALIVHHGIFWNFHGVRPLAGPFARRVFPLVRAEVNLLGYHLPLDAHPEVGNAAGLARGLGMAAWKPYGTGKRGPACGVWGELPRAVTPQELSRRIEKLLSHSVMSGVPDSVDKLKTLAIITGGANGEWIHCVDSGIDAYLTGEMSEHDWHESREAGVCLFAGGAPCHRTLRGSGAQDVVGRGVSPRDDFYRQPQPRIG